MTTRSDTLTPVSSRATAPAARFADALRRGVIARTATVRRLAAAAFVTILVATGMLATAQPASAATSVSYCFRDNYGAPFALRDTSIQVWNGYTQRWALVAYDRTGWNGCSSVNTYPWRNYYLRVSAGTFTQNYVGTTPSYANPGNWSGVWLGTGYVYLRR